MLTRFPGEPAMPASPLDVHSLAMLGVLLVANEALEMASRRGDVGFPFDEGVATGFISGDWTDEEESSEWKVLGGILPTLSLIVNCPAACFFTAAVIDPCSLASFFAFLGMGTRSIDYRQRAHAAFCSFYLPQPDAELRSCYVDFFLGSKRVRASRSRGLIVEGVESAHELREAARYDSKGTSGQMQQR